MKTKRIALITCVLALASASTSQAYWARTWDTADGYTWPDPAVQGDNVWVGVYGQWPTDDTCIPDFCAVTVAGDNLFVDIYDAYAREASQPGPSDYDLGDFTGAPDGTNLGPGYYNLYVAQYSNLWPLPAEEYAYVRGDDFLMTFAVYYKGDINYNGTVDVSDLLHLAYSFGLCLGDAGYNPDADLTGDDCVDVSDILILATNWGRSL